MLRLLRVFFEPEKVFPEIAKQPGAWRVPFIATLLVTLLTAAMVIHLVGMQTIVRNQLEASPRIAEQMGPDKLDQAVRNADTPARHIMSYVMAVGGSAISLLIVAGVLLAMLHLVDAPAAYSQVLAVCSYAFFAVGLVGGIGAIAVLALMSDHTGIEMNNLLKLNPTIFLERGTGSARALYSIATSLDLMTFWMLFLMALGLSKLSARLKLSKALVLVAVPWVAWIAAKAGLAMLF